MAQAPVRRFEMYGFVENTRLQQLAEDRGWRRGEENYEYVRDDPRPRVGPTGRLPAGTVPAGDGSGIRAATGSDLGAICALHDTEFPGTYASARELLDPDGPYRTLVEVHEETVLGYIAFQPRPLDSSVYLEFVAITPSRRRTGAGRRLIDAAQAATGASTVELTVDEHRPQAIAFYEALGFRRSSATRPYRFETSGD